MSYHDPIHYHQGAPCRDTTCAKAHKPAEVTKAKVILFKPSGKYYTEEHWEIPATVKDYSPERGHYTREVLIPYDMKQSKDFRRISGGPVLVESQEPWGYPHLFPGTTREVEL